MIQSVLESPILVTDDEPHTPMMKQFLLILGLWIGLSAAPVAAENTYFDLGALSANDSGVQWAQNHSPQLSGLSIANTESPKEEIKLLSFEERFAQKQTQWGLDIGYGYTFDLPPVDAIGDRTNFEFLYFFPKWKYNLTGIKGQGFWQGALYWVVDGGITIATADPTLNGVATGDAPLYVIGFSPIQAEYKFLNPHRKWAPFVFAGAGISIGDWHKAARELDTALEFILNVGGGLEYFFDNGTSINFAYRLWHLSNSNIKGSNIGLNSHIFTLGFNF